MRGGRGGRGGRGSGRGASTRGGNNGPKTGESDASRNPHLTTPNLPKTPVTSGLVTPVASSQRQRAADQHGTSLPSSSNATLEAAGGRGKNFLTHCIRDIGNTDNGGSSSSNNGSVANMNNASRYKLSTNDCSKLLFIHTNCQSAMNKGSEISAMIDEQKPHVLAFTEFGAGNTVTNGELGISGYTLYRGDHSSGGGGLGKGVGVYVANTQTTLLAQSLTWNLTARHGLR